MSYCSRVQIVLYVVPVNGWHIGCLILACMKVNLIVKLCASSWLDTFIPLFLEKKSLPYLESNFCSESEWHVLFSSCLYHNFYDFLNNHEIVAFEYGSTDCMSYVEHILVKCIFARVYRSVDHDKEGSNLRTWTRCACTYKDCSKMPELIDC